MTEITINHSEDEYKVSIKGHAGFATAGHDIVCAAVSTLTFFMANWLNRQFEDGEIYAFRFAAAESGEATISFIASQNKAVETMWQLFTATLYQLSAQYPKNIFIK